MAILKSIAYAIGGVLFFAWTFWVLGWVLVGGGFSPWLDGLTFGSFILYLTVLFAYVHYQTTKKDKP